MTTKSVTYPFSIWFWTCAVIVPMMAIFVYASPALAKAPCYDDWSDAAVVVEKNKLVKVAELDSMVRDKLGGRIVKTTLCPTEKGYVYKIVVRKSGGQLQRVSVDAKTPFKR